MTSPLTRARAAADRLRRPTIWAPGAIPVSELKYGTPVRRFVVPLYSALAVWAGIKAVFYGIPAVDALMPHYVSDGLSALFAVIGAACLVGVIFPRLWALEAWGQTFLVLMLAIYYAALVALSGGSEPGRSFVSTVVAMAACVSFLELCILGAEWRKRRDDEAIQRAVNHAS